MYAITDNGAGPSAFCNSNLNHQALRANIVAFTSRHANAEGAIESVS
jgi:hypothetical protein